MMGATKSPQEKRYIQQISEALDQTWLQVKAQEDKDPPPMLDLKRDRYIIFSDLHRGARNGADDFRLAERAYNAALAYYYELGHHLIVLGDCEELWEERPSTVIKMYRHSLELEARFHQEGRYMRFWGNHDDDWRRPNTVNKHLSEIFGRLKVWEARRLKIMDEGQQLGWLFLAHGHQGTLASDKAAPLSRLVVRYFWRNWQRITKKSLNVLPSDDWQARDLHNKALYSWAEQQPKQLLIAGHTHRPVFASETHPAQLIESMDKLRAKLTETPNDADLLRQLAELAAELEWVRAQNNQPSGNEGEGMQARKPCYFNSGCCCFVDGNITGIELADGEIRLIRMPNYERKPLPRILVRANLKAVLARC